MAAVFMAIMGIVFWIVPGTIVSLYIDTANPANAAVVSLAKTLLGVAAMFQLVDGVQVTAAGALRGLKDTKVPLLIGILAYWAVGLTCGYTLGFVVGICDRSCCGSRCSNVAIQQSTSVESDILSILVNCTLD
jgi:MATE family multidrug resistance protein